MLCLIPQVQYLVELFLPMKKIIVIFLALLPSLCVAQMGSIVVGDLNFRQYLTENHPSTIYSDSLLNTSACLEIMNIDCSSSDIHNLDELQYFINLDTLICSYNPLTELNNLPPNLIYLNTSYCVNLSQLNNLPSSLIFLDCSYNQISQLPILPIGLKKLFCAVNNINSIDYLPHHLTHLDCSFNNLTELPFLPSNLIHINCSYNQISSLPDLPEELGLTYNNPLNIFNNNIECVGTYPNVFEDLLGIYESCSTEVSSNNLTLEFSEGWSIFTLLGNTANMNIDTVLSDIIDHIVIIKDNDGNPFLPNVFNGIGNFEVGKAYQIKTNTNCSSNHVITEVCPESNSIELNQGWNLFGYIRNTPAPADLVLDYLNNQNLIQLVKNSSGAVYIPSWGYNGIGNFTPGEGYQIKVSEDCSIHFLPNNLDY